MAQRRDRPPLSPPGQHEGRLPVSLRSFRPPSQPQASFSRPPQEHPVSLVPGTAHRVSSASASTYQGVTQQSRPPRAQVLMPPTTPRFPKACISLFQHETPRGFIFPLHFLWKTKRQRYRNIPHWPVHSTKAHNSQGWATLKPELGLVTARAGPCQNQDHGWSRAGPCQNHAKARAGPC